MSDLIKLVYAFENDKDNSRELSFFKTKTLMELKKKICQSEVMQIYDFDLYIMKGNKKITDSQDNLNKSLSSLGLGDETIIYINEHDRGLQDVSLECGIGAAVAAADIRKKPNELIVESEGPDYRTVVPGLNIFGKCVFESCVAKDKEVVDPKGYGEFNFVENYNNCFCPMCHSLIKVITTGFWLCEYNLKGTIYDETTDNMEKINKTQKTRNRVFDYYNPEEGTAVYVKLTITTKKNNE